MRLPCLILQCMPSAAVSAQARKTVPPSCRAFRLNHFAMASSGPDFVAVPAMLLPADSALVLMTAVDLRPPRLDTAEPTAARVEACAGHAELLLPQYQASYLLKLLYKAPLLASGVRLELLRRGREKIVALWRKKAKDNRTAAAKRKRAAAAAAKEEFERTLRPRVAAASGQASGSSSSVAAAAGGRGPDRNAGRSSGLAAPAPGLPRPGAFAAANLEPGAAAAIAFEPGAAAANALGEEAGSAADTDDGEGDYEEGGLLYERDSELE